LENHIAENPIFLGYDKPTERWEEIEPCFTGASAKGRASSLTGRRGDGGEAKMPKKSVGFSNPITIGSPIVILFLQL
jgi:hypothetical protein